MALSITQETLVVNNSPNVKCWRMVYNNERVLQLFESTGVTQTVNNMFCSDCTDETVSGHITSEAGKQECLNKANELGLTVPQEQ